MASPTSPNANYYATNGTTPAVVIWGTEGIYSSYIVKNVRFHPMVEEIPIQNGTGLTVKQVLLNDGMEADITVVDDGNVNPPVWNSTITLVAPPNPTTGAWANTNFIVIDSDANLARKQDGERVIKAKKYSLI